jgi:hypothetical protein
MKMEATKKLKTFSKNHTYTIKIQNVSNENQTNTPNTYRLLHVSAVVCHHQGAS